MIKLTPIVSRSKIKCSKSQKDETIQILKNDVLMLILCLSYFITTVTKTSCGNVQKWVSVCNVASHRICDSKEGFSQQKSWMLSIWLLLKSPLNIYIWSLAFIQIYYEQVGKKNKNWSTSQNHVISQFCYTQTPNFPVQFLCQMFL